MKSGCRSRALAAASSSALGTNRRKIIHTSTSIWAMPVRSSVPIALRYSVSIRAWAQTRPIRQIVPTLTWTELERGNAACFVMPELPAMHRRPAVFGAVHAHDACSQQSAGKRQIGNNPSHRRSGVEGDAKAQPPRHVTSDVIDHEALRLT